MICRGILKIIKNIGYVSFLAHSLCYNAGMMNIYKYIRSKDVKEYNEKIGHKFTATESSFLVWHNPDITLKEKHDAWRQIMAEMQDEEVANRPNSYYAPSLFALLNKFIENDNALIDEFYKKDDKTVYSFSYLYKGDSSYSDDFGQIYSDFEFMQRELDKDDDLLSLRYTKKYLSSPYREIVLETDKDGNVLQVSGDFILANGSVIAYEFFDALWIDVPTPFRYGDIVCSESTPFGGSMYNKKEPFVLISLANWSGDMAVERGEKLSKKDKNWKNKHIKYLKENGDITDMTACGYFLVEGDYFNPFTGGFYREVMHDYVDLEYYRGDFSGGERVLLPIKYFLSGDIDEETLVKACNIIKKQEEIKNDVKCLNLLDEWIEKIGIKNN
mgnify:CR=1 FL=1